MYYYTPFRDEHRPLLSICASEAANDGFSATINAVFIFYLIQIIQITYHSLALIINNTKHTNSTPFFPTLP